MAHAEQHLPLSVLVGKVRHGLQRHGALKHWDGLVTGEQQGYSMHMAEYNETAGEDHEGTTYLLRVTDGEDQQGKDEIRQRVLSRIGGSWFLESRKFRAGRFASCTNWWKSAASLLMGSSTLRCSFLSRSQGGPVYVVDKILDSRVRRGIREHLLRWRGFRPAFDSWIPASDIR